MREALIEATKLATIAESIVMAFVFASIVVIASGVAS